MRLRRYRRRLDLLLTADTDIGRVRDWRRLLCGP